jgi:hypothetical protein
VRVQAKGNCKMRFKAVQRSDQAADFLAFDVLPDQRTDRHEGKGDGLDQSHLVEQKCVADCITSCSEVR